MIHVYDIWATDTHDRWHPLMPTTSRSEALNILRRKAETGRNVLWSKDCVPQKIPPEIAAIILRKKTR